MRRLVHSALLAGVAAFAATGPAAAADNDKIGMPQLNYHDFAPQLVWLGIAFLALYLVMSRMAVPRIADTLAKRQAKIQGDLDAAEKANEETKALVAAYEKRLADSREEARRLLRNQNEADAAAAAARFSELHDRLARQIDEAEKRIARQRDDVMAGLEHMAEDIGREVYAKLAGQPADGTALAARVAAAAQGTGGGGHR
jgi:F-type H+-transporting ATPase subunit b